MSATASNASSNPKAPPVCLSIAGSDSGGGAGIQADLKTFQAFGCFGTTAITAVTCQNTTGVSAVQGLEPDIVAGQLHDVLADFPVGAAKTGMLFSAPIIEAVAATWHEHTLTAAQAGRDRIPLIADPVMVSTSGHRLLEREAEQAMIVFLKSATLITPNIPEAEVILGRSIGSLAQMHDAAQDLANVCDTAVLLKGGHRLNDPERAGEAIDIYYDGRALREFSHTVLPADNTHGTGCTLSAAIAAGLARKADLPSAIGAAREYLRGAIEHAPGFGAGSGPLNHMWR